MRKRDPFCYFSIFNVSPFVVVARTKRGKMDFVCLTRELLSPRRRLFDSLARGNSKAD